MAEAAKLALVLTTDPLAAIMAELGEIEDELVALDADYRQARKRIDDRTRRVQSMVGKLTFEKGKVKAVARVRVRRQVDPHVQAGPKNLGIVTGLFREHGKLTQADVTRLGKLSSGTTTHAIKALALDGVIEATGKTVGRSREFRLRGRRRGSVTRIEPGEQS